MIRIARASIDGDTLRLDQDDVHYLIHVLRRGSGARVELFDGEGNCAVGTLAENKDNTWHVDVEQRMTRQRPVMDLTVACAAPKGERATWLVEKLAELGVSELVWLTTERSVVHPVEASAKMERLRRVAMQAARQSGRSRVLKVRAPLGLIDFLQRHFDRRIVADPGGVPLVEHLGHQESRDASREQEVTMAVLIGPEGGLSIAELSGAIGAGYTPCALNDFILRVETAALAAAATIVGAAMTRKKVSSRDAAP